ncbi:uncharacterized protein [Drosophila pseudoobscura]|uniref:Uncharacterized protein n=1 Tax=Drosophila pseudoobscura pseudoobscura TaxID=46245 RepID=A0A6I8V4S3_DROPS|nr:uncharacterized protein LOC6898896 [Drosophila pseudoobscura]
MIRWPFPVLCICCILYSMIHPHGLLAASVYRVQLPGDIDESTRQPTPIAGNMTDSHGQSREFRQPTGLYRTRKLFQFSYKRGGGDGKRRVTEDLTKERPRGTNESLQPQPSHVDFERPRISKNATIREPEPTRLGMRSEISTVVTTRGKNNQDSGRREGSAEKRQAIGDRSSWPKELTLPLARGIAHLARRVDNPWYVTYPNVWHDTRLAAKQLSRIPRIHLASSPTVNYYPDDQKLQSVCKTKSTLFYNYSSFRWNQRTKWRYSRRHTYDKAFSYRRIHERTKPWIQDLECHTYQKLKITVLEHLDCVLKAYQLMEYDIPFYPLHQNG